MNVWLMVTAALLAWMLAGVLLASAIGPGLGQLCDDASAPSERRFGQSSARWVEPVRWVVPACIAAMAVASSTGLAAAGVLPAPAQVAARSMFNTMGVEIPDAPDRTGGGGDETVESADATPAPPTAASGTAGADQPANQEPQRLGETRRDVADAASPGPTRMLEEVGGVSSGAPVLARPGRPSAQSTNPSSVPSPVTPLKEAPPAVAVVDGDEEQKPQKGKDVVDAGVPQEKDVPAPARRAPTKGVAPGVGPETVDQMGPPAVVDPGPAPLVAPTAPAVPADSVPRGTVAIEPPILATPDPKGDGSKVKGEAAPLGKDERREATAQAPAPSPVIVLPIWDRPARLQPPPTAPSSDPSS